VLAVVAGSVYEGRDLAPAVLVRLPLATATMHLSWGAGFLSSPRKLAATSPHIGTIAELSGS
jgi:hypothetical protein